MDRAPTPLWLVPSAMGVACATALLLWLNLARGPEVTARLPGQDGRPAPSTAGSQPVAISGTLVRGQGTPSSLPGEWPQFRGPRRDNVAEPSAPLARSWPATGPRRLWRVELGDGYAGPAVLDGRVYVLDYDRAAQADTLRCLSLDDGRELWHYAYPMKIKRDHGMSRTVPAVGGGAVVTLGPKCVVLCVDAVTGEKRWAMDLVQQFGTEIPLWYAGQCPLIEGQRVILAPAGSCLLMAVDLATGQVAWQTPNRHGWKMTHSSVMPLDFAGRRMLVYCGSGGVVGVDAADGRILWQTDTWKVNTNVPSPVMLGDGRILLTAGYGAGSRIIQLRDNGDGAFAVQEVARFKPAQFACEQQTPILFRDRLYTVLPRDAGADRAQLVCMSLDGQRQWISGKGATFGLGPFLATSSGLMFLLDDLGLLTLADVSGDGFVPLAQAQVLSGHDAWGPMALVGTRLLARDLTQLVCLEVGP